MTFRITQVIYLTHSSSPNFEPVEVKVKIQRENNTFFYQSLLSFKLHTQFSKGHFTKQLSSTLQSGNAMKKKEKAKKLKSRKDWIQLSDWTCKVTPVWILDFQKDRSKTEKNP